MWLPSSRSVLACPIFPATAILLLFGFLMIAQDGRTHHVDAEIETRDGKLHFDGYLCRPSPLWKAGALEIYGTLAGDAATWRRVTIQATVNRADDSTMERTFTVGDVRLQPWKNMHISIPVMSDGSAHPPDRNIVSSSFKFLHGVSEASIARKAAEDAEREKRLYEEDLALKQAEEAARQRDIKAKALAAKKKADAPVQEAARVAKLPQLVSGRVHAFLGSDRKCAEQFQQALTMDGLEKRKRIADLLSYDCGILVDDMVHVSPIGFLVSGYRLVSVEEGNDRLKRGWVPESWVHSPTNQTVTR
jgi:hypothetical protein